MTTTQLISSLDLVSNKRQGFIKFPITSNTSKIGVEVVVRNSLTHLGSIRAWLKVVALSTNLDTTPEAIATQVQTADVLTNTFDIAPQPLAISQRASDLDHPRGQFYYIFVEMGAFEGSMLLDVFVNELSDGSAIEPTKGINSITGTPKDAAELAAIDTIGYSFGILPTGTIILMEDETTQTHEVWRLVLGTANHEPDAGIVRPHDFNLSSNARIWRRI